MIGKLKEWSLTSDQLQKTNEALSNVAHIFRDITLTHQPKIEQVHRTSTPMG
jgi:hypothetical protein